MSKKYVLITGASSGIGKSIAERFAKSGRNLVLVASRIEKLQKTADEIKANYNVEIFCSAKNLSVDDSAQKIYDELQNNNIEVDVLVNCAGIGGSGEYSESDWAKQKAIIDVDVIALMHMTRLFLPQMLERKDGVICNIASNAGFAPLASQPAYGAAKAYVISFSQALYEQVKDRGVCVSVYCPGPTNTAFFERNGFELANLSGSSPDDVAEDIYNFIQKRKAFASFGAKNKFMAVATRLLPRKTVREIAAKMGASK